MDYRKLLESKGFVLNNYPEDGKFWELVVKDDEDLKRHICKVFKTDVELLDNNVVDIDKVILQCAEDYSRCVFYYDCNLYNMETDEFMKCIEKGMTYCAFSIRLHEQTPELYAKIKITI